MLQECWVDGMPVCYSPTGWHGVAKGKTDDGKFIFEASYGVTYYVKNTDVFEIGLPEDNNGISKAFEEMGNTICPYRNIINEYFNHNLLYDEAYIEIVNTKVPEGIKPEAPVVEYFNKYRDAFVTLVNAYSEKYNNTKTFIKNVCGDNLEEAKQTKWGVPYVRRRGKIILKIAGIPDDIVKVSPISALGCACESDITFGKIKLFDDEAMAYQFVKEEEKNGFIASKYRVNGFCLCCSRVLIVKPYDAGSTGDPWRIEF